MYSDHLQPFYVTLADILKSVKKIKSQYMRRYDLRSSHVMVLYLLGRHPEGLTPTEIAEANAVDKALISRVTAELEERGLLSASVVPGGRYRTRIYPTPQGLEIANAIASAATDIQRQVSTDIPPEDLEVFYRTLFTLQENFHRITDPDEE